MNVSFPKQAAWIIYTFLWVLLSGCSSKSTLADLGSETMLETGIPTPSSRVTISPSVASETIQVTKTTTSLITKTMTSTATFIPKSSTPEPTLLPEESQELFLNLMQTNGGCEFPCVWGISPGSDAEAIRRLGNRFGEVRIDTLDSAFSWEETMSYIHFIAYEGPLESSFSFEHVGNPVDFLLFSAVELLGQQANLLTSKLGYFQLANVLSIYEKPTEILIGPWWDDPHLTDEWLRFGIVLYYPEKGFLAEYFLNQEKDEKFFI